MKKIYILLHILLCYIIACSETSYPSINSGGVGGESTSLNNKDAGNENVENKESDVVECPEGGMPDLSQNSDASLACQN